MKVHTLKSLGAKLFYLMTTLVLITVIGNSWQFFRTFRNYQLQQMQDSLQSQAERAKDQIENTIDNWRAQVAVSLPTLRGTDAKQSQEALQRFVDANQDFIFIDLYSAPTPDSVVLKPLGDAATSRLNDKNFEDKEALKVIAESREAASGWLKVQIPKPRKNNFFVDTLARTTNLPIMVLATRFEVAGSPDVVWAVLGTWQSTVMRALLKSNVLSSAILDSKGHIFSSLDPQEMLGRRSFSSKPLLRKILATSQPSGFESEYRDGRGRSRVGAYARLQRYNLTVVIEQDAEAATQTVNKTLVSTSLWAAIFVLFAIMFSFFGSSGITRGLRAVAYATSRIAGGDLQYQIPRGSEDEVGALGQAVNHMSGRMLDLLRSQIDQARFEKELETAKMVQSTFFPKEAVKRPQFNVTGFYTPASECGGDLWGHFSIADGLEFVFIADAMGHGAPAALVTAIAYSTTMTVADIIKTDPTYRDSPGALLERINRIIYEAVRGTISMTFFASIIDLNKGTLTYANAGHNFPVVVPLDPSDPRLGKATKASRKSGGIQPISLKLMGTPLGIDPVCKFKEQTFDFKAGDKLFFFTDGLIECLSPRGEQWGRKHLLVEVGQGALLGPQELCNKIVNQAFQFFGGVPLADDITVVVAEIGRDWKKPPQRDDKDHIAIQMLAAEPRLAPPAKVDAAAPAMTLDLQPAATIDFDLTLQPPSPPVQPAAMPQPPSHIPMPQLHDVPSPAQAPAAPLAPPQPIAAPLAPPQPLAMQPPAAGQPQPTAAPLVPPQPLFAQPAAAGQPPQPQAVPHQPQSIPVQRPLEQTQVAQTPPTAPAPQRAPQPPPGTIPVHMMQPPQPAVRQAPPMPPAIPAQITQSMPPPPAPPAPPPMPPEIPTFELEELNSPAMAFDLQMDLLTPSSQDAELPQLPFQIPLQTGSKQASGTNTNQQPAAESTMVATMPKANIGEQTGADKNPAKAQAGRYKLKLPNAG